MKNYKLECVRARARILTCFPHLSPLVLGLPYYIVQNCPTGFVTNQGVVGIGDGFIDRYTNAELAALFLHEGFHAMLNHGGRAGGRNHEKWNLAADLVINETLRRMTVNCRDSISPDADMVYPEKFGFVWDVIPTAEAVYAALPDGAGKKQTCGSGSGGKQAEWEDQVPGNSESIEELRVKLDLAAGSLVEALKKAGAGSAELELWTNAVIRRPKFDLFRELRTLVAGAIASNRGRFVDPTWNKMNRRGFDYLPGRKHFVPEVTVIVDTSGSMFNGKDGDNVLTELSGILLKLGRVRIVTNDTRVSFDGYVRSIDEFKKNAKGGGGTELTPAFRRAEGSKAVVVLTDGELGRPDHALVDSAVWLLTSGGKQPWMKRALVLDRR